MPYLVDNPPARSQYRSPRRARPTGCIVIHSAENAPDINPPDTGAENVARFIQGRSTPGSYHDLCDSDSTINLVHYSDEAYQDGTGSNPWALSVSGAFQAHQWRTIPLWWRNACIDQMAGAARRQADWLRITYGIHVPARRITRSQSEAGMAGFISHAERDPGRRSDPGAWFPWDQFLTAFSDPTTTPLEDDMAVTVNGNKMVDDIYAEAGRPGTDVWREHIWPLRIATAADPFAETNELRKALGLKPWSR